MLIHTPRIPNNLDKSKAIGILKLVNIMLMIDGIFGFPMPVNNPLEIISMALKISEKAMILK